MKPRRDTSNFYDDPFLHMIEEVDDDGRRVRSIGGAHNIFVAARAYEESLRHYHPHTRLMLREKSRVLRLEPGNASAL